MTHTDDEITRLLVEWSKGDETALERLMPMVTDELRRIAGRYFERESPGHTLQPTALVNELYLRLVGRRQVSWKNRAQFFGFAAQSMRRILVDHARHRNASIHGDGVRPLSLDEIREPEAPSNRGLLDRILDVDAALKRLAELDPRQAKVAELRLFADLTHAEIGEVLEVTSRTVKRDWRDARLWLHRELES